MTPTVKLRNFKSLTKFTYVGLPLNMREQLTANRTYYVSPSGSNSNNGLSAGSPFLTIQKAVDVVTRTLDLAQYNVTIQLADGTYTSGATLIAYIGTGAVTIQGNTGNANAVVINPTNTNAFVAAQTLNYWNLSYMRIQVTGTSGGNVVATNGGTLVLNSVNHGSCPDHHIACYGLSNIVVNNNYTISGGARTHMISGTGSSINNANKTITLSGTPAFTERFVQCWTTGFIFAVSLSFSGAATGQRYMMNIGGVVQTNTGNTSYFPGNSAGATTDYSVYN
jgi:hypothetical protein